jgi:hypothetical protein
MEEPGISKLVSVSLRGANKGAAAKTASATNAAATAEQPSL